MIQFVLYLGLALIGGILTLLIYRPNYRYQSYLINQTNQADQLYDLIYAKKS